MESQLFEGLTIHFAVEVFLPAERCSLWGVWGPRRRDNFNDASTVDKSRLRQILQKQTLSDDLTEAVLAATE
jgi:hypothetical protein